MARKKTGIPKQRVRMTSERRGRLIALGLLVILVLTGVTLAEWGGLLAGQQRTNSKKAAPPASATSQGVTTQSLTPSSPSKEYIYAGGRLVATEEPSGGGGGNPPPTISQLIPNTGAQGSSFAISIPGTNLAGATSINFSPASGITVSNLNSSATQVSATITIAAAAATGARDVSVTVGSQTSNTRPFTVTAGGNPAPVIISLDPNPVPVSSQGFMLTVNGSGFVSGATVSINGSPRTTNFLSDNQLTAQMVSGDRSVAGARGITVTNPDGQSSLAYTLTVTAAPNPPPHIDMIDPQSVTAGGPGFTMTVTSSAGTFVSGATVRYDGLSRTTTFVNANTLTALIPATDISITKVGVHFITVVNPGQGGVSNQVQFTVSSSATNGTGLRAQYFNNMTLCGTPALTRTEAKVDFWTAGSPVAGINPDQFSIRWTGQVQPQFSETYTFYVRCDDGVRLWVNNQLLIDKWFDQYIPEWSNTITLAANQKYDIRMDYYENWNGAEAHLSWSSLSTPKQIIPTARLYPPTGTPALYEGMVEVADCSTISGWALDRSQPNTAINVSIYDGTTLLATIAANQSRPDLIRCSGETGQHGFSWPVPQSLRNGVAHTIRVKYGTTAFELGGSPKTLNCSSVPPPPPATSLSAVAVSASQIDLQWQYAGTTQNGFVIQRNVDSAGYSDYVTITSPGVRTYSDINQPAGHTYCYKVLAYNGSGRSAEPNPTACATLNTGGGGIPAPPSNLTATYSSSPRQVALHWTDNSFNETSFQVRRRYHSPSGNWTIYVTIATLPANTTSYNDVSGLSSGYSYGYIVRAFNGDPGGGMSDPSNEAQLTIPTGQAPTCAAVTTLSGSGGVGSYGYVEASNVTAKWGAPSAGATGIDPVSGLNALFVADTDNQVIRMVYLDGPAVGSSRLIAGSGVAGLFDSDDAYEARFNNPQGLAVVKNADGVVQAILIGDTDNRRVRQVLPPLGGDRWRVTTLSGTGEPGAQNGDAATATFKSPRGIAVGLDGSIYVADTDNAMVRVLNSEGYASTWYQGAKAFKPVGLAINEITGQIYVSDQGAHRIGEVTSGVYVVLVGSGSAGFADGSGTAAAFNTPQYLAWADTGGNGSLYIADLNNSCLRVLDLGSNAVTTWAGSIISGYQDANCAAAKFYLPSGVAFSPAGDLYVIDKGNNSIRKAQ